MKEKEQNVDDFLADVSALLDDVHAVEAKASESPVPVEAKSEDTVKQSEMNTKKKKTKKKTKKKNHKKEQSPVGKVLSVFGKIFLVLLETALLLVIGLYGLLFVLAKGPSTTARDLFVMSVRETSAMGWLANLYFTDEEIARIENRREVEEFMETDTSLIQIPVQTEPDFGDTPANQGPKADAWGLIDEDGDGIILEEVKGEGYSGYMMVVLDPSRVIVGSVPATYGSWGYTVEEMVRKFDAVAGTNAGGFLDPDGKGDGSIPDTLVVYDGQIHFPANGTRRGFVGMDSNHFLHVSTRITEQEIREKDIRYGVCFGPVLISNGEPCDVDSGGVNPRTAIGQRSDGAMLLLVIDGRQVISMGATMHDLIDIMLDYGAVNACNLDGGSSTLMWYQDGYVNNCASVIGIRPVPTAILVLKEGESGND